MSEAALSKTVRLLVPAAKAKPSPAIGQALGQLGVNMMMFCKDFNAKTTHYIDDVPLRVKFTAFPNKTFTFVTLAPTTSWFIKTACGFANGSKTPGHESIAKIHVKQLYHIALVKRSAEPNLQVIPVESIVRSMVASCRSMGVEVDASPRDLPIAHYVRRPAGGLIAAAPSASADTGKGKKKK